jgi:hypothetical protein
VEIDTRLQEAIKQTNLAIEDTNQSDVVHELEDAKEALEKARERLGSPEA